MLVTSLVHLIRKLGVDIHPKTFHFVIGAVDENIKPTTMAALQTYVHSLAEFDYRA